MAKTVQVQSNGKAEKGLSVGDSVVTQGGTYKITGVNADGSYQSSKVSNSTVMPTVSTTPTASTVGRSGTDYSSTGGDIGTAIRGAMASGASADTVSSMLGDRTYKASTNGNLSQYAYDSLYDEANQYIKNKYAQESEEAYNKGKAEEAERNKTQYSGTVQDLVNQILNGSYSNYLQSDEYNALSSQYMSNGQRAMKDTLAEVSNRTGGLASSYASTAGTQAYNNYMEALNSASLNAYNQQQSQLMNKLSMLQSLDDVAYQRSRDAISDSRYADETSYNRSKDEYAKLLANAQTLANYGDFSGYEALGYTPLQIANMKLAYDKANSKSSGTGTGYGYDTTDAVHQLASDIDTANLSTNYTNYKAIANKDGSYSVYANPYTDYSNGKAVTKGTLVYTGTKAQAESKIKDLNKAQSTATENYINANAKQYSYVNGKGKTTTYTANQLAQELVNTRQSEGNAILEMINAGADKKTVSAMIDASSFSASQKKEWKARYGLT